MTRRGARRPPTEDAVVQAGSKLASLITQYLRAGNQYVQQLYYESLIHSYKHSHMGILDTPECGLATSDT